LFLGCELSLVHVKVPNRIFVDWRVKKTGKKT